MALTAAKESHQVSLFLAGDAVHLLSEDHADVTGLGTGRVGDHLAGLKEAEVEMGVSGMSAKARGYDEALLAGLNASFGMPTLLLSMAGSADTVLCY